MATIYVNKYPNNDISIDEAVLCTEEFYDNFVFYGNSDYEDIKKAEWFEKAEVWLGVLDFYSFSDFANDAEEIAKREDVSIDTAKKIIDIYQKCRSIHDIKTIVDVANILYPDRTFDHKEIHGCCQGEWQDVAYDTRYEDLVDEYEEYFFGQYVVISWEEENVCEFMTYSEYEELDKDALRNRMRDDFVIDDDEELTIMESAGYVTTMSWAEV